MKVLFLILVVFTFQRQLQINLVVLNKARNAINEQFGRSSDNYEQLFQYSEEKKENNTKYQMLLGYMNQEFFRVEIIRNIDDLEVNLVQRVNPNYETRQFLRPVNLPVYSQQPAITRIRPYIAQIGELNRGVATLQSPREYVSVQEDYITLGKASLVFDIITFDMNQDEKKSYLRNNNTDYNQKLKQVQNYFDGWTINKNKQERFSIIVYTKSGQQFEYEFDPKTNQWSIIFVQTSKQELIRQKQNYYYNIKYTDSRFMNNEKMQNYLNEQRDDVKAIYINEEKIYDEGVNQILVGKHQRVYNKQQITDFFSNTIKEHDSELLKNQFIDLLESSKSLNKSDDSEDEFYDNSGLAELSFKKPLDFKQNKKWYFDYLNEIRQRIKLY